jgi:hypothetical protein
VHRIQFADPVSFLKQNRGFSLSFPLPACYPKPELEKYSNDINGKHQTRYLVFRPLMISDVDAA